MLLFTEVLQLVYSSERCVECVIIDHQNHFRQLVSEMDSLSQVVYLDKFIVQLQHTQLLEICVFVKVVRHIDVNYI